ncbi:MAG: porin [Betaproteobacteria bacterium]|nr:porin [Betaproteobacteria bacterium]
MKRNSRSLAGVLAAGVLLLPGAAAAADDASVLRAEIEALKKEVQELRGLVKGRISETTPGKAPQTAGPRDLSTTVLGATVTLYGTLNADAGTVERTGATASATALNSLVGTPGLTPAISPSRSILRSNSSNFGIRGVRHLFGSVNAVFQVESSVGADGGASNLAGRDTFLGLSGSYGSLLYGGNIDSPYKRGVQGKDPFFATGIATQKGILGSPGFNVTSVNAVSGSTVGGNAAGAQQQNAGFDTRLNNLVMYRSPVFAGFSGELAYGMNEQNTTTGIKPSVISAVARYDRGPWFASYAYEEREDVFALNSLQTLVPGSGTTGALFVPPAGATSKDSANKIGVGYKLFSSTDLLLVWENLKYTTSVGAVREYERDAWVGSVNHRMGRHHAIVSYSKAEAGSCSLPAGTACSTKGLGAEQWALGYVYDLDASTWIYAFWTQIRNEEAAAYNFGVSGAPAAGVGADPKGLALGIRYRF